MTSDLAKIDPTGTLPAPAELGDTARAYAVQSKADNTRRAYAAQIKLWQSYCDSRAVPSFPAVPEIVCDCLAERAGSGQSYSTLRTAIAAVRAGHIAKGMPFDSKSPCIASTIAGIGRVEARAQRQAEPIRGADIVAMLARLGPDPIDLRDGALLALGYVFGLRRSELVAVDLERQGAGDGFVRIGATTVDLVLARSKTGKAGEVETVTVPRDAVATAVAAIERWIASAGIEAGEPVLRSAGKGGSGPLYLRCISRKGLFGRRPRNSLIFLVPPPRLERGTPRSTIWCSNQLS